MADKVPDSLDFAAQLRYLVTERRKNRRRLLEAAVRDGQLDQGVTGLIAAAKALGKPINAPADDHISPQTMQSFRQARYSLAQAAPAFFSAWTAEEGEDQPSASPVPSSPAPATTEGMPKIADIVLERLKMAGKVGLKATSIREHIEQTYHAQIHEKTVGMTLYRLQKAGEVTRDGHTWFVASPEAKNPGGTNAGAH
ncbi:MAG: hypothetical protein JSR60_18355 [Proteobacteria bacterium]|nr:hypothetical protein [Pseudomonadota bacterium]